MNVALLVLAVVVACGVGQLVRAQVSPWKPCPRCKGSKKVWRLGGFAICARCDKDGKVPRWGASVGRQ